MIYKLEYFLIFFSSISVAMNNDFSMVLHMRNKEQRGECMILLNGTVLDYQTGTVLGKIDEGRFIAKTVADMDARFFARLNTKALKK